MPRWLVFLPGWVNTLARKTCGMCLHGEPVPSDLTKVTCFGNGINLVVTPQGFAMARIQYPKAERACALWVTKEPVIVPA